MKDREEAQDSSVDDAEQRQRRTVLVGTTGRLVSVGLAALFTIGSARFLDPTSRGHFAFDVQLGYLVGSIFVAGRERATLAGLVHLGRPRQRVLFGIALLALSPFAAAALSDGSVFTLAALPAMTLSVVFPRLVEADLIRQRAPSAVLQIRMAPSILMAVAFVVLAALEVRSYPLWTSTFAASQLLPTIWVAATTLRPKVSSTSGWRTPEIAQLALGDAAIAVAQRADRVTMGLVGREADLGSYTVAASLTELAVTPLYVAAQVRSRVNTTASRALGRASWFVSTFFLAVLAFAGPTLLRHVAGPDYVLSKAVWLLLCLSALLISLQRTLSAHALSSGGVRRVVSADVLVGAVSLSSFVALVPTYGATGAAAGTCLGYTSGALLLYTRRNRLSTARDGEDCEVPSEA